MPEKLANESMRVRLLRAKMKRAQAEYARTPRPPSTLGRELAENLNATVMRGGREDRRILPEAQTEPERKPFQRTPEEEREAEDLFLKRLQQARESGE